MPPAPSAASRGRGRRVRWWLLPRPWSSPSRRGCVWQALSGGARCSARLAAL